MNNLYARILGRKIGINKVRWYVHVDKDNGQATIIKAEKIEEGKPVRTTTVNCDYVIEGCSASNALREAAAIAALEKDNSSSLCVLDDVGNIVTVKEILERQARGQI